MLTGTLFPSAKMRVLGADDMNVHIHVKMVRVMHSVSCILYRNSLSV